MNEQNGNIKVRGIVSKTEKNEQGDLEIFLKVNSMENLPRLNSKERFELTNSINKINFLTYQIVGDEKVPTLNNLVKIEAGIPYSIDVLRNESFKLDGSLINYLTVIPKGGKLQYYFPLEM